MLTLLRPGAPVVQAENRAPRNLELVGQGGGSVSSLAVRGQFVYAAQGNRLVVVDVGDPTRPRIVGQTAPRGTQSHAVVAAGGFVYVGVEAENDGEGGL